MSVIEKIQSLFKTKSSQPEDSMDMASVGTPGDPLATVAMNEAHAYTASVHQVDVEDDVFPPNRMATADDEMPVENPDLLILPLLGRKTMAQHQRILVTMLVLAVAVLGIVTFLALSQAGKVAQQLGATGQSLMQSQRLAKSVSQALVGSAQAFPDVRESADVMAKSVRGLKAGDTTLNLAPVISHSIATLAVAGVTSVKLMVKVSTLLLSLVGLMVNLATSWSSLKPSTSAPSLVFLLSTTSHSVLFGMV